MKMTTEQNIEELKSLFHKVAGKEPLDADEQGLLDELLKRTEWKEVQEKLSDGDYVCGRLDDLGRYQKREAFEAFSKRVYGPSARVRFIRWIGVAASVLLVIGVSLFLLTRQEKEMIPRLAETVISAGTQKASLVLATGEVIAISDSMQQSVLGGMAQVNSRDGELVYSSTGNAEGGEKDYNELIVPRGGEYTIVLDDGTKVKLNANSRLRYPVKFSSRERRVEISGEAFFDVAKNEKVPFIVTCGKVRMTVLGTSFNVNSYEENPRVTTTLVSGKLEVGVSDRRVVLTPGFQSRVDEKALRIDTSKVDLEMYTGWINNKFVFKDESLELVLASLSRWYDVEFVCDGVDAKDYTLTGKIPRHGSLQEVVVLLEKIADVQFRIEGRNVIVTKK